MNFLIYFWPRFRICFRTWQIKRQVSIIIIRIIFTPQISSLDNDHCKIDWFLITWGIFITWVCVTWVFVKWVFQNWEIEVDVTYRTCCIFYIDPSGFTFLKITNFCKKFTLELIKILDPLSTRSDLICLSSVQSYFQSEIRGLRPQAFGPSFGFSRWST